MGEYARRKSDGQEVKIGTCESMYYLRYEDRDKVEAISYKGSFVPLPFKGGNLFWRLPFPDEDDVQIGEYQPFHRGIRLFKTELDHRQEKVYVEFKDLSTADDPGIIQLRHPGAGLLASVNCYHGNKLPNSTAEVRFDWNGRGHHLELAFVKNHIAEDKSEVVLPVVRCRFCQHMWRYSWDEILPYVSESRLRERLEVYAKNEVAA
jgi:hypothetical protein